MRKLLNTLYLTNPDALLRKQDDALRVELDGKCVMSVPFHVLDGVVLFGHVGCSMAVLRACGERGVSVVMLDERGGYTGRFEGPIHGTVLLRREQYKRSVDSEACLTTAKRFVVAKVHNTRVILLRQARDHTEIAGELGKVAEYLHTSGRSALATKSLDELRGVEGDAAHAYFSVFGSMIRVEGIRFNGRNRRPARDPANAMLSFFYAMLARDVATACEAVGLDPQMGYLHACRPGRMSLALDLMEELRAPVVDRFVLGLINRKQMGAGDFRMEGEACTFTDTAIKRALALWQERKREEVVHPYLKEKVPIGLLPFVQAQLLARYLRGDLDDYPAFLWR